MTISWLAHVRKTMGENPGQPFTLILKRANRTYRKKNGGKKGVTDHIVIVAALEKETVESWNIFII